VNQLAPDIAIGEADDSEVIRGKNWRLRAARRQEKNSAGNDIDVVRVDNKLIALSNHQKDTE
jgi:hypothetical protein